MSILLTIWFRTAGALQEVAKDERGEVVTWVVLAVGIVAITTAAIVLLRPGILKAAGEIVNQM
jgi:hypothetical protein